MANAYIVLFSSYGWNLPTQTDKNGHYLFDWQEPGKYVLGLNLPGRPNSSNRAAGKNAETHPTALFYPGVAKRSEARVIQLRTICRTCLAAVACSMARAELPENQKTHICNSAFLAERGCLSRAESMRHPAAPTLQ